MIEWFVSELKEALAPSEAARFALDLSSKRVALVERTSGGFVLRGVADHRAPDFEDRLAKLRKLVTRNPRRPARVDLLLPQELTLFRIETFPDEAKSDLRREAWWRLERWAPYKPEELCYDVSVLESDPRTGFISVAAAVAPREIVEEAVQYAASWGFRPQRVSAAADFEGFPSGPVFLEAANPRREMRTLRRRAATLLAAAVLVGCLGAYRAVAEREATAAATENRLAETEQALQSALEVRTATHNLASRSQAPMRARVSRHLAVERLRAVAAALPPEAVLTEVVFDGRAVRIVGEAPDVDAVRAALNLSPAFADAIEAETAPYAAAGPRAFAIEAVTAAREPGA